MLATACATLLCVVFGTAASSKVTSAGFREFVSAAGLLALLPAGLRTMVGVVTVTAEFAVTVATAAFVFTGRPEPGIAGFVGAACLLGVFTVAIGIALSRGDRLPCRCFGAAAAPLGREHATLLAAGPPGLGVPQVMRPAGELVDDFKATTVDGEVVSVPSLDGPIAVGFFSPDCPACAERLPEFLAFAEGLPADRARPLVVAMGDDHADLVDALRPVARVVVEPVDGPVTAAFGVKALPALCVVGPTGRILASGPEMSVLASYVAA